MAEINRLIMDLLRRGAPLSGALCIRVIRGLVLLLLPVIEVFMAGASLTHYKLSLTASPTLAQVRQLRDQNARFPWESDH